MACIKAVVEANDEKLIAAHKTFAEWKKNLPHNGMRTDYGRAMRHFNKCRRSITKCCDTFFSNKSYARSIVTTQVINGKVYWQSRENIGWKQASREPPPVTSNGLPTKVLYNYNRDDVYRFDTHCTVDTVLTFVVCIFRQRYKQFIRVGCTIDKTRYTGEDNAKLGAADRAKRFIKYLQVCCNLHRGKDFKYIKDVFSPLLRLAKINKENVRV